MTVREGGRIVNVVVVIASAAASNGNREVLGLDVVTSEDGAGWLAFLRPLVARGCEGCSWSSRTVTKDYARRSPPSCQVPPG